VKKLLDVAGLLLRVRVWDCCARAHLTPSPVTARDAFVTRLTIRSDVRLPAATPALEVRGKRALQHVLTQCQGWARACVDTCVDTSGPPPPPPQGSPALVGRV
jgi:hypothetical protein